MTILGGIIQVFKYLNMFINVFILRPVLNAHLELTAWLSKLDG